MTIAQGKFITIEGGDGAGKSGHIPFMVDLIEARGIEVVVTREPGGTPLSERLREMLLTDDMDLKTEALIVFASRNEHLHQVIRPALARGAWVFSDRFTDSSIAYQVFGRQQPRKNLNALIEMVHPGFTPDRTWLFDVTPEVAMERIEKNRGFKDRMERESMDFLYRVRSGFLTLAAEDPSRFCVINSGQTIEQIREDLRIDINRTLDAWTGDFQALSTSAKQRAA